MVFHIIFVGNDKLWGAGGLYYRLEVVDKNGSKTYSEVKEITIINSPFSISPNPAKDYITINGPNIKHITITDISGRTLILSKEKKINISNLQNGVYLINIETSEGNRVAQKLLKMP